MREIILSNGMKCKVDDDDFKWLCGHNWEYYKKGGYAYTRHRISSGSGPGSVVHQAMHRMIAIHHKIIPDDPNVIVDHKSTDRLDNRKENLRSANQKQNAANRNKTGYYTSSSYKGVSFDKKRNKYRATIRVDRKLKHLGYFDTEVEAANVYDAAALDAFGSYARLNRTPQIGDAAEDD